MCSKRADAPLSRRSFAIALLAGLAAPTALRASERGLASWYGPGFHGKTRADGGRYDQESPTAAHKTLPFGTLVMIRNVHNGRRAVVVIRDRGPYKPGRVIDVSHATAGRLGMLQSGVAPVELEILRRGEG